MAAAGDNAVTEQSAGFVQDPSVLDEVERRLKAMGGSVRMKGKAVSGIPQRHTFTPGLYSRELRIPAGTFLTSKVHKTEHQYVVSAGVVQVYNEATGDWDVIHAPHLGITKPGTRRLLIVLQDLVWTTFHVTDETDLEKLEDEILEDYKNPLLFGGEGESK